MLLLGVGFTIIQKKKPLIYRLRGIPLVINGCIRGWFMMRKKCHFSTTEWNWSRDKNINCRDWGDDWVGSNRKDNELQTRVIKTGSVEIRKLFLAKIRDNLERIVSLNKAIQLLCLYYRLKRWQNTRKPSRRRITLSTQRPSSEIVN